MLNEADTRAQLIDPVLEKCGWSSRSIQRELKITEGRIISDKGARKKGKRADYVLYAPTIGGIAIAIIEAKEEKESALAGMQQAKDYAQSLRASFAYSTNGRRIEEFDFITNNQSTVVSYPSPDELLARYNASKLKGKRIDPLEVPYYFGEKIPRYYQQAAIKSIIEAYLLGQKRILITMATGTGKTLVAFDTAWKLHKSGNIRRILYITDRVFLRGQAYNAFEPFGDARADVDSSEFTRNREMYFYNYQTLFAELEGGKRFYQLYPRDFFDLVIIDECHRSGFGTWNEILQYFDSAVHLGMTATPKRDDNINTYRYFGEPVYTYSLGEGIEDGFLAPYKIHKIYTNIDLEGGISLSHATAEGATVIVPESSHAKKDFYTVGELEKEITIPARTKKICQNLTDLMLAYGPKDKTMVFCVNDEHASEVAKQMQNNFAYLGLADYAVRIVAEERDAKGILERFVDSEKVSPVIATTVDYLSTGIDVPSVKNIVLIKPIASKVLFKQIIGRGSRIDPDVSKYEFRIIDYVGATELFDEWDYPEAEGPEIEAGPREYFLAGKVIDADSGQPIGNATITIKLGPNEQIGIRANDFGRFNVTKLPKDIEFKISASGYVERTRTIEAFETQEENIVIELRKQSDKPAKIVVDGIQVYISKETTLELVDGRTLSKAEYVEYSRKELKQFVLSLEDLRAIWVNPQKRAQFFEEMKQKSVSPDVLTDLVGRPDVDTFDAIAHIIFGAPLLTRDERAEAFLNLRNGFVNSLGQNARGVLLALLNKYKIGGIENISPDVFELPPFDKQGYVLGIAKMFGGLDKLKAAIDEVQRSLYSKEIEK